MAIPTTGHKCVHGVCIVCEWKDPNYQEHEVGGGSGSSWNKGDDNALSVQTPEKNGKVTDVTLNGKPLVEGTDYVEKQIKIEKNIKPAPQKPEILQIWYCGLVY